MSRIMNAAGTIKRGRYVKIDTASSNSVKQAGFNEPTIGICALGSEAAPLPYVIDNPPVAATVGNEVTIYNMNSGRQDISLEIGAGGCLAGDELISDADGRGIVGQGNVGAIALEPGSEGELVNVMLVNKSSTGVPYIPYVFDADGVNGDTDQHVLIPATINKTGLFVLSVLGVVKEVFAGSSQDQGIVTIKDDDGNTITTLTPSDAGADDVNDILAGWSAFGQSTGAAGKYVAPGKGVYGYVSQQTSGGTPSGKTQVIVLAQQI